MGQRRNLTRNLKYFEQNEVKTQFINLWNAVKLVFRGKL